MCSLSHLFWGILLVSGIFFDNVTAKVIEKAANRNYDACGIHNGRRIYLEQGHGGFLIAKNVTMRILHKLEETFRDGNRTTAVTTSKTTPFQECNLELVSCPICAIKLTLIHLNISNTCPNSENGACGCDHLEISEPPYDADLFGQKICNSNVTVVSKTRSLYMTFKYTQNYDNPFVIQYTAEENQEQIDGVPSLDKTQTQRIISTPFFPAYYPRDFGIQQQLQCQTDDCRVHVNFIDFQLAITSVLEITNGKKIAIYTGLSSRPSVIISTGTHLSLRFNANGATALGYQAIVSFLSLNQTNDLNSSPRTDCGGYVESLGGAITMMRMLNDPLETINLFDCIWLVRPSNKYLHLKTHLSLRIDTFHKLGSGSELKIHQGMTSDGPLLGSVSDSHFSSSKTFIIALSSGFYIRLIGEFNSESSLAIVFSAFSYSDCYIGSEFTCENHRCIPIQLHCDSFDHCGDHSDEPESCQIEWETVDRRWYSHTPNYYFPKMEQYPDLKAATIVFITSSLGMISLIACLIFIIYRMGARARHQRQLQNHLQTITDHNRPRDEIVDEPPVYEAPPDYEDVIKIGMDREIRRSQRRRRREESRGRRNERRKSEQPILESSSYVADTPTPSDSNVHLQDFNPSSLILDYLSRPFPIVTESSSSNGTEELQSGPTACGENQTSTFYEREDESQFPRGKQYASYTESSIELPITSPRILTTEDLKSPYCSFDRNRIQKHLLVYKIGDSTPHPIELGSNRSSFDAENQHLCNNCRSLINEEHSIEQITSHPSLIEPGPSSADLLLPKMQSAGDRELGNEEIDKLLI